MAEFRGLTHQIARVLLLALCMSLFAATLSLFNPDPALARPGHIAASAGDLGGALEAKPDDIKVSCVPSSTRYARLRWSLCHGLA